MLNAVEPIAFPTTMSCSPLNVAVIDMKNSGKLVAMAINTEPIKSGFMHVAFCNFMLADMIKSLPFIIKNKPAIKTIIKISTTIYMIFFTNENIYMVKKIPCGSVLSGWC